MSEVEKELPVYVSLHGIELKLFRGVYHRVAGLWDVDYKWVLDELFSVCPDHKYLDNVKLMPITKEQWEEGNRGYI